MGLKKRVYTSRKTCITSQNLNDIQDAIIALEGRIDDPSFPGGDAVTDEHINELIDAKLGVIENGAY
jgi:hypothetical protein